MAHAGSRDHYQLALALHEAGLLADLVTELYVAPPLVDAVAELGLHSRARLLAKRSGRGLDRPALRLMPGTLLSQCRAARSALARAWASSKLRVTAICLCLSLDHLAHKFVKAISPAVDIEFGGPFARLS